MSTGRRWLGDARGATSIEYGLICALVALGLVACLNGVGGNLSGVFAAVVDGFGSTNKSAPPPASPNAVHP